MTQPSVAPPIVTKESPYSVKETADRLEQILHDKNIQLFARINHGQAAKDNGLELEDEELLIFGDPKVGTYLMQECPETGIELPLKIIIWHAQKTWIGYREPQELLTDYSIVEHRFTIKKMSGLLSTLVTEAIKK
ncbi:MAG: DUF302 domain-containing protein [Candidatus Obscuribacter sp.]|nr:DUF302 domain-containing protein [Candidatus Obscuribacter sp.]MBK9620811.1 DUF302 domain-containing protein [Candidatus Obscuribacter sp.]